MILIENKITGTEAHQLYFQMTYELNDLIRRECGGHLIAVCSISVILERTVFK